jgi:RimJ/RimL family protein N-acetyltransferase
MSEPFLHTRRLALREMTRDDFEFVAMMLADPLVMRHYKKPYSRSEAEQWLNKVLLGYEKYGHSLWLVSLRATGEPIGQVGLIRQSVDDRPEDEIGYLIHHPYWRQGYAAEAAGAVRDHAFQSLDRPRVISLVRPVNIPSQRVALRVGMRPEKLTIFNEFEHLVFARHRDSSGHA